MSSGPWRFLPPCHTSRFLPVPRSTPAFLPFPAVLSALPALLWAQLPRAGSSRDRCPRPGEAQKTEGRPGRSSHSRQTPPAHPGPRSGLPVTTGHGVNARGPARQPSGTGGMEPARTMAELIRTSADGKGHGPHNGKGGRRGPGRGETGPRSEALPGYRPVTAAAPRRARLLGAVSRGSRARASGKAQRSLPITGARRLWDPGPARSSPHRQSGPTPRHRLGPSTSELRGTGS